MAKTYTLTPMFKWLINFILLYVLQINEFEMRLWANRKKIALEKKLTILYIFILLIACALILNDRTGNKINVNDDTKRWSTFVARRCGQKSRLTTTTAPERKKIIWLIIIQRDENK